MLTAVEAAMPSFFSSPLISSKQPSNWLMQNPAMLLGARAGPLAAQLLQHLLLPVLGPVSLVPVYLQGASLQHSALGPGLKV